jgi:large subunit ribosomal protein L7/L12
MVEEKQEKKEKKQDAKEEIKEEAKKEETKKKAEEGKEQKVKKEEKKEEVKEEKKEEAKKEEVEEKSLDLPKKVQDIIDSVEKLNVLELSNLVKALEQKFGVSAQAMQFAVGAAPQAGGAGGGQEEEKSTFDVVLTSAGDKKIQVIKEIRSITQLGLKEAKDLVDKAPQTVKEGADKEEADKIKKQLEEQGASVELK